MDKAIPPRSLTTTGGKRTITPARMRFGPGL
jgi:hypothetical protein